jgi:hypothetical protein
MDEVKLGVAMHLLLVLLQMPSRPPRTYNPPVFDASPALFYGAVFAIVGVMILRLNRLSRRIWNWLRTPKPNLPAKKDAFRNHFAAGNNPSGIQPDEQHKDPSGGK